MKADRIDHIFKAFRDPVSSAHFTFNQRELEIHRNKAGEVWLRGFGATDGALRIMDYATEFKGFLESLNPNLIEHIYMITGPFLPAETVILEGGATALTIEA